MPIKPSTQIPFDVNVDNKMELHAFLIALKQYTEEIARKASSSQIEVRNDAPSANDLEEGEQVRATVGGLNYIYTKKDGVILRWQIS